MTPIRSIRSRQGQQGVAALAVALVLLFGITLVAFFTNRSVIFEQRTSANQYRSTKAFEMAEAGLEWAVARLNDDLYMSASAFCATEGANKFNQRYLPFNAANTDFNVVTTETAPFPGCSVNPSTGATTCSCPTGTSFPSYGDSTHPRFRVAFTRVDTFTIRITSYGCTNQGKDCDGSAVTSNASDAVAVVSAVYKMRPTVANAPGAGLVTGGGTTLNSGNLNVYNLEASSGGVTIDSGGPVDLGSAIGVYTLPGTPPRSSVLTYDDALNDLTTADTSGDTFFKSFFGKTLSQYQNDSRTWIITSATCPTDSDRCTSCSTDTACGQAVSDAYNDFGARQFWADTPTTWTTSNVTTTSGADKLLASSTAPIIFASSANIKLGGSITAYGLFYCATATADAAWDTTGTGTATVYGAFISRGEFERSSGTLNLVYDSSLFGEGAVRGTMVRAPGTWRDRTSNYTTSN